jgi:peptidoglycan-N-acetylglucosamine deacetylase
MHVGAFDAHMLPRLLQLYKAEGVEFVSLQEAERDRFYRNDPDLKLPATPDTLEAALALRQISVPHHTSRAECAERNAPNKVCR